jgi:uridine phosphorylase
MGIPMTDFVIRETRAVVKGPMIMIRLGTCGSPHTDVPVGSLSAATLGSVAILRNPDVFAEAEGDARPALGGMGDEHAPYHLTKPVMGDKALGEALVKELRAAAERDGSTKVVEGMNASACSFYSSQGRVDPCFDDRNASLVDELMAKHPNLTTIEMESFHLFDLARCSTRQGQETRCSACTIVLAQRKSDDFLPFDRLKELEACAGEAVLRTVATAEMPEGF